MIDSQLFLVLGIIILTLPILVGISSSNISLNLDQAATASSDLYTLNST